MRTYQCSHCGKENIWVRQNTNKYCDNKCSAAAQRDKKINAYLYEGHDWGNKCIPAWMKDKNGYLARERGYACECCGISEWNGKEIVLECDHKDGVRTNNKPSNLRLVCPNCHSQTDTFKGRNK